MNSTGNDDILHRFGQKVRAIRLRSGYSQEKLAERANLHRTYIGSIERGEQNISLRNIEKLALALGVSPATLLEAEIQQ